MGNGHRIINLADPEPLQVTLAYVKRMMMLSDFRFFYLLKVLNKLSPNPHFKHPYINID